MPKITRIDRDACRTINRAIEKALAAVATEHGVAITIDRSTFDSTGGSMSTRLAIAVVDASAPTVHAAAYRDHAALFDLKPEWLGQTFTVHGQTFKIVGLNTRARAKPVIVERGGNQYVMADRIVRAAFEAAK